MNYQIKQNARKVISLIFGIMVFCILWCGVYQTHAEETLQTEEIILKTGWEQLDNTWYYYQDGNLMTGWQQIQDKWYYLTPGSGQMVTGWKQLNDIWYYLHPNGSMATGWQKIGNTWYYLHPNGAMATGWQKLNGTWYYLYPSGAMATKWAYVNNKWYYFNSSGAMQTGWQKVDNKWYYMNSSGAMLTGWQKINNKWYYLNSSGAMQVGWLKLGNTWYYLNSSGAMVTSTQNINNVWYAFNADGAMTFEYLPLLDSYYDNSCAIQVFRIWYANSWCYCAHIKVSDYKRFGTASANGYYGNGRETVYHAGDRLGAILCVNSDFADQATEPHAAVRRGVVEAKGSKKVYACEAYNFYTGKLFNAYEGYCWPGTNTKCSAYTYNEAVSKKLLTDTFIFGPAGLNNGILKGTNTGTKRPRTLIGTTGDAGDIWLVVTSGDYNDGVSAGLTGYEGGKLLYDLGCTFGGHLDGGGSSAMYFNGRMLVANEGWEGRYVADFAYVK